ncbi:TonB-dependent receptor plug domain-containing protein [Pelagicoccus albus]|uniref:TonB-dependent receptor n=1 Tax=Pelagicoccus albus TaxID=415222 RepID=A0A7X1E9U4_9BACT|nr:TonB-dependent receptor [Pelagicoccus albus]MBC2607804.1 TonB-dependent receptor [Pelagicoccus albus]
MKYTKVLRRSALPKNALLGSFALAMIGSPLYSQEMEEDTTDEEVKTYTVTGSRIRRIDLETPSPVLVISRDELDATGFATVGDALRALPIVNGQSLNSADAGTSFTPGVSSLNLRGLGNNNTLALINGRRAALYPSPGFNGFQSVFDYNSVPVSAIESIQIQKDGASAIYGSDAVAGVVNIELRKDFEGMQTQISFGDTWDTGSFEEKFFAIAGTGNEKTSIVYTVDFTKRNALFARDLDYTDSADATDLGSYDWSSSAPPSANVRGLDPALFPQFPSGWATTNGVMLDYQDGVSIDDFVAGNVYYNFQEEQSLFPEQRSLGFYSYLTHEISDTVQAFAEVSYRHLEMNVLAAPTPAFFFNENGDSDAGTLVMPVENPYNPFGVELDALRWRMVESGPRENDLVIQYPRFVGGLQGEIGFDWTWETSVAYSKSSLTNYNRNSVVDDLLQDALNGIEIDGETLYANPFGTNDPRVIDYFTVENPNDDSYEALILGANASGVITDMPAGPLGVAFGVEYREDNLESVGTILNETSQIVGGSAGTNTFGYRDVTSAYAELSVPVLENLELQLAARYEDYSDFGDTTKPKAAFKFRPTDWLLFRASYGQSFRAPDLSYLYAQQSTSFSSSQLIDPKNPDVPAQQIRSITGGNPDLGPEETDVTYAGIIISPSETPFLKDFQFSFEFFEFDQSGLIDSLSASEALTLEDTIPGLVVRAAPAAGQTYGQILYVNSNFQNIDSAKMSGYDIGIKWLKETDNLGDFRVSVDATMNDSYTYDGYELIGTDNYPEWRGTARFAWNKNDWAASLYVLYIDEYPSIYADYGVPGTESQWLFNPQVSYSGLYDTKVTFGVRNVFNSEPPRDKDESMTVNTSVNSIEPAFWYLRLTKDF